MNLYQTGAGWYDPYSTQGIHAGVSVPQAPAGLSLGGTRRIIPAQAGDNLLGALAGSTAVEAYKAGVGQAAMAAMRIVHQAKWRALGSSVNRFIQAINQWSSRVDAEYAARVARTTLLRSNTRWYQPLKQIGIRWREAGDSSWYAAQRDLISEHYTRGMRGFADQAAVLGKFDDWLAKGEFKNELLGLGIGASIDLSLQAIGDVPMLFTGDLTGGQFVGRMAVTAGGSIAGWGVGWGVSKLVGTAIGGPAGFIAGIAVAVAYEHWIVPRLYDRFNLWPKHQQVGPAEPPPY